MISSMAFGLIFQVQGSAMGKSGQTIIYHQPYIINHPVHPAGVNMTTGSNMTGAAGNTTQGAHGSSIPTTHPAGVRPNRL